MIRALFRAATPLGAVALVAVLTGHPLAQPAPRPPSAPAAPSGPGRVTPARPAAATPAPAPDAPSFESAIATLKFREIGPAVMGGRVDDFAVVESDPSIVYAGLAAGGLWKTVNGGTTWTPIFDNEEVPTIGDVTVAPSDPDIVWVGTGEANNRQSSSWGNGIYKSTDAGRTWKHMGLRETQHIGRIVIHPRDSNVVYAAALGRLWGPNKERGLYKTSDGGATWKHVLAINEDTGVVDVAMDPESPDTLYAAAYQRRRTVFGFTGSGPDGGIYKTTDGGATWKKLVKGLPWDPEPPRPRAAGGGAPPEILAAMGITPPEPPAAPRAAAAPDQRQEIGRIGVNVYRGNPSIVYAVVEHASGGVFRSEDKGETWQKMSDVNPRPMYYSKIHIDPNNDQRVWVLGTNVHYSEDGGRTFVTDLVQRIHVDFHAFWINPANSNHMIAGSDGGIHWSYDRGRTWDFVNNIAIGQFYEIGLDNQRPYRICGGLQDNDTWCGPSSSTSSTRSRRTATSCAGTCARANRAASGRSRARASRPTGSSGTRPSSSPPTTRRPSITAATSSSSRSTAVTAGPASAPTSPPAPTATRCRSWAGCRTARPARVTTASRTGRRSRPSASRRAAPTSSGRAPTMGACR